MEAILGIDYSASKLQSVEYDLFRSMQVDVRVKRDDLLHPVISGNKWRKLKYCIQHAIESGQNHIISMGGTWSNHLHALAYIGKKLNIRTTGLIRGENARFDSPTLNDLKAFGMQLHFVSRTEYRKLREYRLYNDPPSITYDGYWIPEGGASVHALKGIFELKNELTTKADYIALACGTGTTLAGLIPSKIDRYQLIGIAALKGKSFLEKDIISLNHSHNAGQWSINHDYHFGGFAKTTSELNNFTEQFKNQTGIPIEPVYTGKLFYGLVDMLRNNFFRQDSKIIVIHTGGLQGNRSVNN